ncbi:MAG: NAD(P)H-quinone dehydrogenase [Actinobacteria bacterium]|nr:NAD(P)H-quinone dehydrogenase [Propionicimonas sp.]MBU3977079.1 NAD(P)H-quinone dehydrogenase [Actinomycetota bacterium]MBU3985019.1 NAD(P)H-quinone dehydrogenase [Actinomycetota bacterium]MBU4007024.1 NAD(P)H-quinone dehydrogenase [Actinomycetota bacterium]MBU4064777.1 NAD(P)H-quinone dehydrogenase [Actinomycetota bacterium]
MTGVTDVVILGGGPGGYEAALVARQLGGEVTLVERRGLGGSAVLTDVVPSKTLIAAAEAMTKIGKAEELGLRLDDDTRRLRDAVRVDMAKVNARIKALAKAQSDDISARLEAEGVRIINGTGRLAGTRAVIANTAEGEQRLTADIVLVATGAQPRELDAAKPDGKRIFNWAQIYNLVEVPEHLIVVGSGVTGAEFASAYTALGVKVTLVSSRDKVLPGQDSDAADVIQQVFQSSGMTILSRARAVGAEVRGDEVVVSLADGTEVIGSHCLMAVGAVPNTAGIGLAEAGVQLTPTGHIVVDRVSRTTARGVYAAGDCTGVNALASVAAMQGRIAMWHSLGDSVSPLDLRTVSANVFTSPEIATVGISQAEVDQGNLTVASVTLPLSGNARAKMQALDHGFVKLFSLPTTGIIIGGVVVAPSASELIHALSIAVRQKLTVDQLAESFTVYPSLSGSVAEAARRLHGHDDITY